MSLKVSHISATELPNVEWFGKSDPYCAIKFNDIVKKTAHINDDLNPKWTDELEWPLQDALSGQENLEITVYDNEVFHDRFLGYLALPLHHLVYSGRENVSALLRDKEGDMMKSMILLTLTYVSPDGGEEVPKRRLDSEENSKAELEEVVVVKGEGGKRGEKQRKRMRGKNQTVSNDLSAQKIDALLAQDKLPNRKMEWQVVVHVHEARNLLRGDINPLVRVSCGSISKETTSRYSTDHPEFEEQLTFNFSETPKEMFDRMVEFKVLHSRAIIRNPLLGSYEFDLSTVYNEAGRRFAHKWLLLTHPDDLSNDVKGYLKISITILGQGDDLKPLPYLTSDEVDIESNLLRPGGVKLQQATLTVKIYQGEDMPIMDSEFFERVKKFLPFKKEKKEHVDPFCVVSFAGKKGETPVKYNDQQPIWRHQLNLPIRFPTMCERLRIQVMDRDVASSHDTIGTTFISMSQISDSQKKDTVPTFGPCFINIYGSPREFSHFPDKYDHLNQGVMEGVSYRGRIMVEVQMTLGKSPIIPSEPISAHDINSAALFKKRFHYKLYGVFLSATTVNPVGDPIEFEVSIGNNGNILDTSTGIQASTTLATCPFYDGCYYYFMPWFEDKPCVLVDSHWEDCTYRITTMNVLLNVADELEAVMWEVSKEIKVENYDIDAVKTMLFNGLDVFYTHLGQSLPIPEPDEPMNKLDLWRIKHREQQWTQMKNDVVDLKKPPFILLNVRKSYQKFIATLRHLATEPQQSIPDVIIWMLAGSKRIASTRIPAHMLFYADGLKQGKLCNKVQTVFLKPPVKKEKELKGVKDGAQLQIMFSLEKQEKKEGGQGKTKSMWAKEVKLIGGEFAVYAETYENEIFLFKWKPPNMRPHWSDVKGKVEQEPEMFEAPPGWTMCGNWYVQERSDMYIENADRSEWLEEIYENQTRLPLSSWLSEKDSTWTNVHYDRIKIGDDKHSRFLTRDDITCPIDWEWKHGEEGEWHVDKNRAVDDEGWEYNTLKPGIGNWLPYERQGYIYRRRRWVRARVRKTGKKSLKLPSLQKKQKENDGWEYARIPSSSSYHLTEHRFDVARRRRHLCKLEGDLNNPPILKIRQEGKDSEGKQKESEQVPRTFVSFKDPFSYELRAYIYQARAMYGSDKNGLSDPYCRLSFHNYSDQTCKMSQCLSPTWDQTIMIQNIRIYGDPDMLIQHSPPVVVEFMDKDSVGTNEYLGQTVANVVVRLSPYTPSPRLDWYPITRYGKKAGELLAAFELLSEEVKAQQIIPQDDESVNLYDGHYKVPVGIRPVTQSTRVEVLCWGVRDMEFSFFNFHKSPFVEIECGSGSATSEPISNANENPNFPKPIIYFNVDLPEEELYIPPLTITIKIKGSYGYTSLIGTHVVKSLKQYIVESPSFNVQDLAIVTAQKSQTPNSSIYDGEMKFVEDANENVKWDPDSEAQHRFDWWTKYYYSLNSPQQNKIQAEYAKRGYDKLEIYPDELENHFNNFEDLAKTFPLYRGKGSRDPNEREGKCVGAFKGSFKIFPLPSGGSQNTPLVFQHFTSVQPISCIVRVYVIQAKGLTAKDLSGKADPYLKVKVGKGGKGKEINDKNDYIVANLSPMFGKSFELEAKLPLDHTLTVSVMDWDRGPVDELIGETKIDLENRYISRYRATCGLPKTFCKRGINRWRDRELPIQILEDWCKLIGYTCEWGERPVLYEDDEFVPCVTIQGDTYTLEQYDTDKTLLHGDLGDPDQRLALNVIHDLCNSALELCKFVPEHVETRQLYNPIVPDIPQGSLQMWVDIFPLDNKLPPLVDISLRKPEKFELRVIVFNTSDVEMDEISVVTGEAMSDIYLKGWLRGEDKTQKTDVHYRSMDGQGSFNWRMVFPFDYIPSEQKMFAKKRDHFYSLAKSTIRIAPCLTLQLWDNDLLSPDDYIGFIDLNLNALLPPDEFEKWSDKNLPPDETLPLNGSSPPNNNRSPIEKIEWVDLFQKKSVRGWLPLCAIVDKKRTLTGKVEVQIEILTEEEAKMKPAGKGRDEPNQHPKLDKPSRPETSFFWLTSPLKSFKYIIWKYYKCHIIGVGAIILLVIALVVFIYTAPSHFMEWVVNRLLPN